MQGTGAGAGAGADGDGRNGRVAAELQQQQRQQPPPQPPQQQQQQPQPQPQPQQSPVVELGEIARQAGRQAAAAAAAVAMANLANQAADLDADEAFGLGQFLLDFVGEEVLLGGAGVDDQGQQGEAAGHGDGQDGQQEVAWAEPAWLAFAMGGGRRGEDAFEDDIDDEDVAEGAFLGEAGFPAAAQQVAGAAGGGEVEAGEGPLSPDKLVEPVRATSSTTMSVVEESPEKTGPAGGPCVLAPATSAATAAGPTMGPVTMPLKKPVKLVDWGQALGLPPSTPNLRRFAEHTVRVDTKGKRGGAGTMLHICSLIFPAS